MPPARKSGERESAARAMRTLERGATTLGIQVARSFYGRWRRMPPSRRAKLEALAANVKERTLDPPSGPSTHSPGVEPREANEPPADAMAVSANGGLDVSEIEVRDLRADLARELERLADADIRAARGPGGVAGETAPTDGQA